MYSQPSLSRQCSFKCTLSNTCLVCFTGAINTSVKRKSAFERLGEDETSTLSRNMEDLSPKIKITKLAKSPVKSPPSKVISLVKVSSLVLAVCLPKKEKLPTINQSNHSRTTKVQFSNASVKQTNHQIWFQQCVQKL